MKKPAERSCQRASSSISLDGLSIRRLTPHPEVGVVMMTVVRRRA
jgi:hypothetical protein